MLRQGQPLECFLVGLNRFDGGGVGCHPLDKTGALEVKDDHAHDSQQRSDCRGRQEDSQNVSGHLLQVGLGFEPSKGADQGDEYQRDDQHLQQGDVAVPDDVDPINRVRDRLAIRPVNQLDGTTTDDSQREGEENQFIKAPVAAVQVNHAGHNDGGDDDNDECLHCNTLFLFL